MTKEERWWGRETEEITQKRVQLYCKSKLTDQKEKNNQTSTLKNFKMRISIFFLNGVENVEQNKLLFLPHKQKELVVSKIN